METKDRYNEKIISMLGKLHSMMALKGEHFRGNAYKKAKESLMLYEEDILTVDDVKKMKIKGIGEAIKRKMIELIETGKIEALEREKTNPIYEFTNIYGIGPKKAEELVKKHNIKTVAELKKNKDLLNDKQLIGLKYYEDILKRIPRKEIVQYEKIMAKVFRKVKNPDSAFDIVGSYRRGATDSGDIDVIISDKHNDILVFNLFLDELKELGIITEFLSRGEKKSLVVAKLPNETVHRRVDFLFTTIEEYPFAILYFTGSAIFNTAMRQVALDNNYTMNEHGIYHMNKKTKGEKVDVLFKNEADIFSFLNMKYKEPHERIDAKAVEFLSDEVVLTGKKTKTVKPSVIIKNIKNKQQKTDDTKKTKTEKKATKKQLKEHITKFIKTGIDYIEGLSLSLISQMLLHANDMYYNKDESEILMSDEQYDILREYVERKYPTALVLKQIGAPVPSSEKVKLPYFMGSMDKIKPDSNALPKWKTKYKHDNVCSAKLDGASGLYVTKSNGDIGAGGGGEIECKLFKRGKGETGQNISHLLSYIDVPIIPNIAVRGELIIRKDVFDKEFGDEYSNIRNTVSGLINSKRGKEHLFKHIDYVVYEVIEPKMKPSDQFKFLKDNGFIVAKNINIKQSKLNNDILSELLVDWRANYEYEIDGIIVADDAIYPRVKGNPEHAFAFKMVLGEQVAEAKVVDVLWEPSKDGYLKPRIRIEPLQLGGVKIEYATAFNAKYVCDNNIGVGTVIKLVRSGDVIPDILEVIKESDNPKMPDVKYKWNDTKVDIIIDNFNSNEIVIRKRIVLFMKHMGVDNISDGTVKKLIKAGYNTLSQILKMTVEDFLSIDGFKERSSNKLVKNLEKVREASLIDFMTASNSFGRGFGCKKFTALMEEYPDVLVDTSKKSKIIDNIVSIDGFSYKTAENFVNNIDVFKSFMREIGMEHKLSERKTKSPPKSKSHPLFGKKIITTGFRDKALETSIKEVGGIIVSSVSKNTNFVIVKSIHEDTSKAEKARELKVPLIEVDEFKKTYLIK